MKTETNPALLLAHKSIALAFELNGVPELSGRACRTAFRLAEQVLSDAYGEPEGAEKVVARAVETSEYEVADLAAYVAVFMVRGL